MRICALSVDFPGAKRPLEEGAKMGLWEYVRLTGGSVELPRADIYLFGAWHPFYSQCLPHDKPAGVLWTSSAGEMDFTPVEQSFLRDLLTDRKIEFIWFGDRALGAIHQQKGFYAPYPLYVDDKTLPVVEKEDILTLFCPTKPSKNILNQLLAVQMLTYVSRRFTLHTNIEGYDALLSEIPHVRHGWLPEEEYRSIISRARVNLACSWAETFNYQAAEAALSGTPSVISPTVPVPAGPVVQNPNAPDEIFMNILCAAQMRREDVFSDVCHFARTNNAVILAKLCSYLT